jgi:hypothetical protein
MFKGEYSNSTPLESVYVPYIDPKTKKLMKRLARLGVVPGTGREMKEAGAGRLVIPTSTATSPGLGIEKEEESLLWTPDGKDE